MDRCEAERIPTHLQRALAQWPAIAGLWTLYLVVLGWAYTAILLPSPLSLGTKVALAVFLIFLVMAEAGLLILANVAIEIAAGRLPAKAALDALKALALSLPMAALAASMIKFRATGAHLKGSDLWFGFSNFRQLAQESVAGERGPALVLAVALLLFFAATFTSLRRLRLRSKPVYVRPLLFLIGLCLGGTAACYFAYPEVPVFAHHFVPELHWLKAPGREAGEALAALRPGGRLEELRADPARTIRPYRPDPPARRPNVVLIMLESIPWSRIGINQGTAGVTPHLDRLAAESVLFTRAYTPSVHSDYAQMAILSSLFPRKYDRHDYYTDLPYPRTLIWDALAPAGWTSGVFSCQNEEWGNMIAYLRTPGLGGLGVLRHSLDWPEARHKGDGAESKVFEETPVAAWARWRRELPPGPYFAYLNFQATHFPYVVPPEAPRLFEPTALDFPAGFFNYPVEKTPVLLNRYQNALHYTDRWVGEVRSRIEEWGEKEETILIVVSDHGEAFYEHEQPTHGTAFYEEQLRSIWMIKLPGVEARRVEETVSLMDLAPSLLSQLGLPPHGNFQGRGDVLSPAYRAAGRPLFFTLQGATFEDGLLVDGRKYLVNWDRNYHRLFDLAADPGERDDLAAREPEATARLTRILVAFLATQLDYYREERWREGLYPPRMP